MDDDELAVEEIEINLRAPREVAARVVVLAAVSRRAFLEQEAEHGTAGDDAAGERFDLVAWLEAEGLADAVSPSERRLLAAPLGQLGRETADEASWAAEALVALGWALNLVPSIPPYDAPADPSALLESVPAPWDKTAIFLALDKLRPEPEIAVERDEAELWHWRAELAAALPNAAEPERAELARAVREVTQDAAAAGLIPPPIDADFPVRGRPYGAIPDDERAILADIATQRLHALNWLCGFGSDWDDVPLEV